MKSLRNKKAFGIVIISWFSLILSSCQQSNQEGNTTATKAPNGKQLFTINCSSCHTIKRDLVGPALAGVESRWPNKELLYKYIRNPEAVIAENAYAKSLFEKYNHTMMTPFPNLKDEEIEAILQFIKTESELQ